MILIKIDLIKLITRHFFSFSFSVIPVKLRTVINTPVAMKFRSGLKSKNSLSFLIHFSEFSYFHGMRIGRYLSKTSFINLLR